uniref:MANSC domain containing 4 n=1 Tax=Salvator merianae TaxID=96440 RepID=A0A8D0BLC0_SALMN
MLLWMTVSEVFLLLGWMWRSDCLCSPTHYYKNCWIRRFPGLTIDLDHSQRRGAFILKVYTEVTGQLCSQTCCLLKNASCNLAVFYYEPNNQNLNCLHIYCPALESCILKPAINVVLYNITPGVDPDLLVFEKLSFKDLNSRSSLTKWERHGNVRVVNLEKCQNATTSSSDIVPVEEQIMNSSTASDSSLRTASFTHLESTAASQKIQFTKGTDIFSEKISSADIGNKTALPTSMRTSHMPSQAHLNISKNLNETKGYSGRNHTSDSEGQKPAWKEEERGSWLLPVVLCSSLTLMSCCTVFFTSGCHWKKSGHYKPRRRRVPASRQIIRYTVVKSCF